MIPFRLVFRFLVVVCSATDVGMRAFLRLDRPMNHLEGRRMAALLVSWFCLALVWIIVSRCTRVRRVVLSPVFAGVSSCVRGSCEVCSMWELKVKRASVGEFLSSCLYEA